MSAPTQRAKGYAQVTIDEAVCNGCGLCVEVCIGAPLTLVDGRVHVDQEAYFGCFACGQCMAVCPLDCIRIEGRDLSPEDMFSLQDITQPATNQPDPYEALSALLNTRRSVRSYQDKAVPREAIDQIIDAVTTAPMGIPPTDVEVLVLESKEAVTRFTADVIELFKKVRWLVSDPVQWLMRPFMSKETAEVYKGFLGVALTSILEKQQQGENWLTYDAPCALYFYTSRYADPADPIIATTYAMLAAHSLGLGSCMLGTIPYCFKYSRKLREKYHIPDKSQQGLMLVLGYPAVVYRRGIKRRLGAVRYMS